MTRRRCRRRCTYRRRVQCFIIYALSCLIGHLTQLLVAGAAGAPGEFHDEAVLAAIAKAFYVINLETIHTRSLILAEHHRIVLRVACVLDFPTRDSY